MYQYLFCNHTGNITVGPVRGPIGVSNRYLSLRTLAIVDINSTKHDCKSYQDVEWAGDEPLLTKLRIARGIKVDQTHNPLISMLQQRKFFHTLRVMEDVTPVAAMLNTPVTVTNSPHPMDRPMISLLFCRSSSTVYGCSPNRGANGKYSISATIKPKEPSTPHGHDALPQNE